MNQIKRNVVQLAGRRLVKKLTGYDACRKMLYVRSFVGALRFQLTVVLQFTSSWIRGMALSDFVVLVQRVRNDQSEQHFMCLVKNL